jgi:hypothetical protein
MRRSKAPDFVERRNAATNVVRQWLLAGFDRSQRLIRSLTHTLKAESLQSHESTPVPNGVSTAEGLIAAGRKFSGKSAGPALTLRYESASGSLISAWSLTP